MAFATIDLTKGVTGVLPSANATYSTPRENAVPLIINGDIAVAQRGTSKASITSSGYYTVDRWKFNYSGSAGTWTQSQESLGTSDQATTGQKTALKMDCTSTSSLGSGGYMAIQQIFEGRDLQLLKKGTSAAEKVTFSFWVKATKTGTNIITMYDNDNNRNCSIAYTVSSSDTWEKKIVNFPADTTGAFGDDNNASLYVNWYLGAGTNLTSGALATTWQSYVAANEAVGQVDNGDNTSNNFHITGIQLEVGEYTSSTIPPFQHESYADNLQRCRRYTQLHMNTDQDGGPFLGQCFAYTSSNWQSSLQLVPPMRAVPTVSSVNSSSAYVIFSNGGTINYNQIDYNSATLSGGLCTVIDLALDGASGGTAGHAGKTRGNQSNTGTMLLMSSEL